MRLRDVLDPRRHAVDIVDPGMPVADAVELMAVGGGCLLVGDGGRLGIVTAYDILACLRDGGAAGAGPVSAVAGPPSMVGAPDDPVLATAEAMARQNVPYLPVMDGQSVAGVLPFAALAAAAMDVLKHELETLEKYIDDLHAARED